MGSGVIWGPTTEKVTTSDISWIFVKIEEGL